MIFNKKIRILTIIFCLFMLTSSCEDKKHDKFGSVSINFLFNNNIQVDTEDNKEEPNQNKNSENKIPTKRVDRESLADEYWDDQEPVLELDLEVIENDSDRSESSENSSSNVTAARITIGSGIPATIDFSVQTSYSKTGLQEGSTVITVELLDSISSNTTLYQQSKNVGIVKNVNTSVMFDNFTALNHQIDLGDTFKSEYTIGLESINFSWSNTHPEIPVNINLINNENAVLKVIASNFTGESFTWSAAQISEVSPVNNVGLEIVANEGTVQEVSSGVCCFNLVPQNNAPVVNDISASADRNETIEITLDGSDDDDNQLTYSIVSNPTNGSLSSINNGIVSYTPNQNFNGTDSFTYKANDGIADSNISTVTVGVYWVEITNPIESTVWASDGSTSYNITWSGGFLNTGLELWKNGAELVDIESNIGSSNSYSYTPSGLNADTDYQIRVYSVDDGSKEDFSDAFTITDGSTPLIVYPSEGSAFDPFNDINILWSNFTFNARIELWKNNQYYQLIAPANMNGQGWGGTYNWSSGRLPRGDLYQIRLLDITNSAMLFSEYFSVNNIAPTVDDKTYSFYQTSSNSSGQLELTGDDYNYDYLTFNIITGPSTGSASIDENILTYNASPGFNGDIDVLFNASDGELTSNVATAKFIVQSNNPPTVNDINVSTSENTAIEINITGSDEDGDNLSYQVITYEGPGTLSDPTNNGGVGLITYTPANNWNGTDEFTYFADDNSGAGNADSDHGTVTIVVTPINNNEPIAENINTSTDEDISKEITLVGSDGDNDSLTYSIVSNASNGSISLNGEVVTYSPDSNWNGTDTFTYKVNDGKNDSNIANVTIVVNSINDVPTTSNFNVSTNEDVTLTAINVDAHTSGDVEDNTPFLYSIVSNPLNGTLTLNSGANDSKAIWDYTPNLNWNGTDTFSWNTTDSEGGISNTSTTTITVNPVNDLPIPIDVNITTNFNTSTTFVLSASDIEGLDSGFGYQLVTNPSQASSWTGSNNSTNKTMDFTYTPKTDWAGVDTFTFKVNDGTDDSETNGTITVTTLTSNIPTVSDLTYSTNEDTSKSITLIGTDVENDDLSYFIVSQPANGTLGNINGNSVTYTPNTNWNGTDTFTYQANDSYANSNVGTITMTVNSVNDVPISNDIILNINEDVAVNIDLYGDDVESGSHASLSYNIVTNPSNGSLGSISDNRVLYTPNSNFNGQDTFTYNSNDGSSDSNVATVTINIGATDDTPVANDISESTLEDATKEITLNGTDPDNDSLTYYVQSNPSNGTLGSLNGNTISYTPNTNWNGTDIFTYKVRDGNSDSNTGVVTITVTSDNDAPNSNSITRNTTKDTAVNIELSATDVEGSALTYIIVSNPSDGALTGLNGNTVNYTPRTSWTGTDSFTYKANDGELDSNISTVTIIVNDVTGGQNSAPTVADAGFGATEDTALTIDLNGSDADGDDLTFSVVSNPSNGTLSSINGNLLTYTPDENWFGTDTFVYQANDGVSNSNTAVISIFVGAVNDAPTIDDFQGNVDEDNTKPVAPTYYDVDNGNDDQTYIIVTQPANGFVQTSNGTNLSFDYIPNENWYGTDTFTYKTNDGELDSNIATATIIVENVIDAPVANDVHISVDEDSAVRLYLDSYDPDKLGIDPDKHQLGHQAVNHFQNGTTILNQENNSNNGKDWYFYYTPLDDFFGSDTVTYKAIRSSDGLQSNLAKGIITVNAINDAPTVQNIEASTNMNTDSNNNNKAMWTFTGEDVDGDNLTFTALGMGPSNGSLQIDGNQGIYTPNNGWSGTDTFEYKANDGESDSNIGTVTINVNAPDPLAKAIWIFPGESPSDEPLTEGQTYKLQWTYQVGAQFSSPMLSLEQDVNFSNAGGGNEDWHVVIAPFDVNSEGTTTEYNWTVPYDIGFEQYYLPNETHGRYRLRLTDAFTQVEESTTSQFLFVNSQSNPVTTDFNTSTSMNESVSENLNNLSSDAEGDNLTFSIVSPPSNGSVIIQSDDVFVYTPATDFTGNDSFTYQANDGVLDSNISTITVMVGNSITVNADVYANTRDDYIAYLPIDYTTVFDINENAPGGVENHTGTSGTPKGQVSFVKCENGTMNSDANNVSCDNEGKYYIRYKGTQSGYDSFSFYVRDINGAKSNMMTAYTYNGYYNSPHSIGFELAGNPPQVDSNLKILTFNDDISLRVRNGAVVDELQIRYYGSQNGNDHAELGRKTIDLNIDGNHPNVTSYNANGLYYQLTLTEELLQEGQPANTNKYSFGSVYSYQGFNNSGQGASSGSGGAVTSIKFISNHRPVANDVAVTTPANARIDFDLSASDEDNDALYYDTVDGPSNGTLSWNNNVNGSIAYIPNNGFHGTDTFTYSVVDTPQPGAINDPWTESNIATVTVTVLNSSTIYMHAEDSHGLGTLEDPMSMFDKMKDSLLKDPDTGYATVILLPGTYTSNYDASAGPNAADETVQINLTTIGIHLKSHSGDPTDTIIERGNHNWQFGSADGGHGDGSGKLKVEGITFRGNRQSRMPFGAQGGGIIIDNCIFSDIENDDSSPAPFFADWTGPIVINNSTFDNMKLKNDRTIFDPYYGALAYGTTITINNSTFTNISSIGNLMLGVGNFESKENININNSQFLMNYDDVGVGLAYAATATHSVFRNFSTGDYGLVNEGDFTNSIIGKSDLGTSNGEGGIIKNSIIYDTKMRAVQGTYTWSGGYNLISNLGTTSAEGNYSFSVGASVSSVSEMLFEDYDNYDFHLQKGSLAVDLGDPNDDYSNEPEPNGERINAGIYGNTSEAQVTNTAPIANNVEVSTDKNTPITFDLDGEDADGDPLTYILSQSNNTTTLNGATITYNPDTNWTGTDIMFYKVNDGYEDSNEASFTITVNDVNTAPTAQDTTIYIGSPIEGFNSQATEIIFSLPGDDLDEQRSPYTDEAKLTYSIVDNPKGWFLLTGHPDHIPNNVQYGHGFSPAGEYESQSMTYKATDSQGAESNIGTVTINTVSDDDAKAIYLKGQHSDSYLDISASNSSITESTIMMWIKILPFSGSDTGNSTLTRATIVADWSTGQAGGAHYLKYHYSTAQGLHKKLVLYKEYYFGNGNNVDHNTDLGVVEIGEWTHIAITSGYNSNTVKFQEMYINGTYITAHEAIQAGVPQQADLIAPARIGRDKFSGNSFNRTSMMIDDYAVFNKRLSQSEIQFFMNSASTTNGSRNWHDFNGGDLSDGVSNTSVVTGEAYTTPDGPSGGYEN